MTNKKTPEHLGKPKNNDGAPTTPAVVNKPAGMAPSGIVPDLFWYKKDKDGTMIDAKPSSGGSTTSATDNSGYFNLEIAEPLERGRPGERKVIRVLKQALRKKGKQVEILSGSDDAHGDDGCLRIDGKEIPVQIVTIPIEKEFWHELSQNKSLFKHGNEETAVAIIRDALLHKATKAKGMLLLLDAVHIGAIVTEALVDAYHKKYGEPCEEFTFADVWIVGPVEAFSIRLCKS